MKKLTTEEFIEKAKKIHGDKYDYSKAEYNGTNEKVCIICPEHGGFYITPKVILRGGGCQKCGGTKKLTTEEFIEKAKETHGDKYDYSKVNYIDAHTKVCIICPEHGEFWQIPNNHLNKAICYKCGKLNMGETQRSNTEEFIGKAIKIHKNKYKYNKVKYIKSNIKVCIICPEHGEFWQTPNTHLSGCGCSFCDISKLEREIEEMLISNNINYIYEQKFEWLKYKKPLELDFYLPDYNIAIECQGIQHFEEVKHFKGKETLLQIKNRDKIKYKLCKEHNIKILYYSKSIKIENIFFDKNKLLNNIILK